MPIAFIDKLEVCLALKEEYIHLSKNIEETCLQIGLVTLFIGMFIKSLLNPNWGQYHRLPSSVFTHHLLIISRHRPLLESVSLIWWKCIALDT